MKVTIEAKGTPAEVNTAVANQIKNIRQANGDVAGEPKPGADLEASAPLEAIKQYVGQKVARHDGKSVAVSVAVEIKVEELPEEKPTKKDDKTSKAAKS